MLQAKRDKYMILNGELTLLQPAVSPFVYQDIHTLNRECRYTAQHIELLNIAADKLFSTKLKQGADTIERQAKELLEKNRTTRNATVGVRLSMDAEGNYRLEELEPTIYEGYTLRLLRPTTLCIAGDIPWPAFPTSALIEAKKLADTVVKQRGVHEALITDSQGHIVSDATKPLVLIREYTATFSPTTQHSIESKLAIAACKHIGLKVKFEHFGIEEAERADELLYVTYQGITAYEKIGSHSFMNIIAERTATAMEELYQASKNKTR